MKNKEFKVIFVTQPNQFGKLVEGSKTEYTCSCTTIKTRGTFQDWINEQKGKIKTNPKYSNVEGVFVHDILNPVTAIDIEVINAVGSSFIISDESLLIRFDYISDPHLKYEERP